MNPHIEEFFKSIEGKLPLEDLISSKTLIKTGLARNATTLARWRKKGYGPAFIKISEGQIFYIRSSIIDWIRKSYTQPIKENLYLK